MHALRHVLLRASASRTAVVRVANAQRQVCQTPRAGSVTPVGGATAGGETKAKTAGSVGVGKDANVVVKGEVKGEAASFPDVNSTTLGLDPYEIEDDPKKWQKFAWKYLGSIVVFLIAYRAVNKYAESLEKDGKELREVVEENKVLAKQFEEEDKKSRERAEVMLKKVQQPGRVQQEQQGQEKQQQQVGMSLFRTVEEEDGFVSELDELRTLRVELEVRLKALEKANSVEAKDEMWKVEREVKDLDREIEELEMEEVRKKSG